MKIDRAGIPFVLAVLLTAVGLTVLDLTQWAIFPAVLAGFFLFFFRDPSRETPTTPGAVVSPADGRVTFVGLAEPDVSPMGVWQQVSVFLSPLDVHVNRMPVSGTVARVDHRPGRFLPAYRSEAAIENERCETWINHRGQFVVCRQVVGFLARRVVCRLVPGMTVERGQRFGIMKFGSRMDVFFSNEAVVRVRVGDQVRGGETVVAFLDDPLERK